MADTRGASEKLTGAASLLSVARKTLATFFAGAEMVGGALPAEVEQTLDDMDHIAETMWSVATDVRTPAEGGDAA